MNPNLPLDWSYPFRGENVTFQEYISFRLSQVLGDVLPHCFTLAKLRSLSAFFALEQGSADNHLKVKAHNCFYIFTWLEKASKHEDYFMTHKNIWNSNFGVINKVLLNTAMLVHLGIVGRCFCAAKTWLSGCGRSHTAWNIYYLALYRICLGYLILNYILWTPHLTQIRILKLTPRIS